MRWLATVLLAASLLAAQPGAGAPGGEGPETTLRVMTLNIFYGGDELNLATGKFCPSPKGCPETLAHVIETIRASGADVVGLEEGEHSTQAIAGALGWHASERLQVVSRYPLIDPPGGNGVYLFVQTGPGRVAAIANVHLPSDPYGPYLVRDGGSAAALEDLEESVRLPAVSEELDVLPGLAQAGIPVFLTGDFNSPSHLDWTPAVAAVRPDVRFPFEWPVSAALEAAGFSDSYRDVHADPVARPGFTWTPGGPESVREEVHDRIDWVLAAGAAQAVESELVGEVGGPDVDIAVDPYPTDHRGVVSTFQLTAGEAPDLVAVESRRLSVGAELRVRFHTPGEPGERVAIVRAGGAPADALLVQPTGAGSPEDGTVVFSTAGLPPGAYEAVLLGAGGAPLSRSPFWLYAPGAPTTVAAAKAVYASGEPIRVSWTNAPGMRWDWLGIYAPGSGGESPKATSCNAGSCGNGRYLLYEYTHASIEGSTTFTANSLVGVGSWPLQPGNYEIRLLLDDGFRTVATSAPFKVVKR